ncbi:unnamed protein product [Ilex paraguariensis]|uniref:Uncharacterized protein n=1 Tax=Ilex paraguariensis TaxID=185542 RepID=A0ABC8QZR7_9AQUA
MQKKIPKSALSFVHGLWFLEDLLVLRLKRTLKTEFGDTTKDVDSMETDYDRTDRRDFSMILVNGSFDMDE